MHKVPNEHIAGPQCTRCINAHRNAFERVVTKNQPTLCSYRVVESTAARRNGETQVLAGRQSTIRPPFAAARTLGQPTAHRRATSTCSGTPRIIMHQPLHAIASCVSRRLSRGCMDGLWHRATTCEQSNEGCLSSTAPSVNADVNEWVCPKANLRRTVTD